MFPFPLLLCRPPRPTLRPVGTSMSVSSDNLHLTYASPPPTPRAALHFFEKQQGPLRADALCRVIGVRIDVSERCACTTALSSAEVPQV